MRLDLFVSHFSRLDINLKINVDPAEFLVLFVRKIVERLRVVRVAFECAVCETGQVPPS